MVVRNNVDKMRGIDEMERSLNYDYVPHTTSLDKYYAFITTIPAICASIFFISTTMFEVYLYHDLSKIFGNITIHVDI